MTECHPRGPLPPPVESAASESHLCPRSPLSISCQSCSLVLSLSLSLSLRSSRSLFIFIRPLGLSFGYPPLSSPTPDAATSRRTARAVAVGGSTGVAWTEINIRRASTYSIPLPYSPRSRPLCPLSSSLAL